jgi:hypothetical protein
MALNPGSRLGSYEIIAPIGAGGPASARGVNLTRELWRGLAEAKLESRP